MPRIARPAAALALAALCLSTAAPGAGAFFHFTGWTASGVATGDGHAYLITIAYHGIIGFPDPHATVVTLADPATGAVVSQTTFYAQETLTDRDVGSYFELLVLQMASASPGVQYEGTGAQLASRLNDRFSQILEGTFQGLTFAVHSENQPF